MRATIARLSVTTLVAIAGTAILGWWTVPVLGALHGVVRAAYRWQALEVGMGAGLSWGLLLAWTTTQGPVLQLSAKVGAVFGLPASGLAGVTLLFAALLAASAATLTGGLRRDQRETRNGKGET